VTATDDATGPLQARIHELEAEPEGKKVELARERQANDPGEASYAAN
jgi:hypothetical protein